MEKKVKIKDLSDTLTIIGGKDGKYKDNCVV